MAGGRTGSPAAVARLPGPLGGGAAPVVVAVDLRRYERWVVAAAREAVGGRATLVSPSPTARCRRSPTVAEVAFAVTAEGAGPFDSHVGTLALVNALVTGVAARLRESATTRVDALESRWRESGALLEG